MTHHDSDCCPRGADGGVFGQESTSLSPEPNEARNEVPTRECKTCRKVLELNWKNFQPSRSCLEGYMPRCRSCHYARRAVAQLNSGPERIRDRRNLRPLKEGEMCDECYDQPHRVEGPKCWRCGELFAELPKLDLRDYLWRTPDREVV